MISVIKTPIGRIKVFFHSKHLSIEKIEKVEVVGDESGSVSMETIMDTVTRVLASVAVLGAVFGLLIYSYGGIASNIGTVQASGNNSVNRVATYISNTTFNTTGAPT